MNKKLIVGVLLFSLLTFLGMGFYPELFFQSKAFLIILAGLLLTIGISPSGSTKATFWVLTKPSTHNQPELVDQADIWLGLLGEIALLTGALGSLLGVVEALQRGTTFAHISPLLGWATLPALYGLIIRAACGATKNHLSQLEN